jgi:hypothetical protein
MLTQVGTLVLQSFKKNRGVAHKRTRKARLAEAPNGDYDNGRHQRPRNNPPQVLQEPRTSETQKTSKEKSMKNRTNTPGQVSSLSKRLLQGPCKRQRTAGGLNDGGQTKRLKQDGQPNYARATHEGILMAIECDGYPEIQV